VHSGDAPCTGGEDDPPELNFPRLLQALGLLPAADGCRGGFAEVLHVGDLAIWVEAEVDQVLVELNDVGAIAAALPQGAVCGHRPVHQDHGQVVDPEQRLAAGDDRADAGQPGERPGQTVIQFERCAIAERAVDGRAFCERTSRHRGCQLPCGHAGVFTGVLGGARLRQHDRGGRKRGQQDRARGRDPPSRTHGSAAG
jgi:hypothetical protein